MEHTFNVGGILHNSLTNGDGMRMVVFFCGCSHGCPGCHNVHLQSGKEGIPMSVQSILDEVEEQKDYIDGITLSGGEPFEQPLMSLVELVKGIKDMGLSIWCYTGYTIESLLSKHMKNGTLDELKQVLFSIDMLVDGLFIRELLDETNIQRGSTNQRLFKNEDLINLLENTHN